MNNDHLTEREDYVKTMMDIAEDFSDGAFLGFMEEKGIGVEDVAAVSLKCYGEDGLPPPTGDTDA